MNNENVFSVVRAAFESLKVVAPNYNPFAGHLSGDEPTKSRFSFANAEPVSTLADLMGQAELVRGEGGTEAILFVFKANMEIGETVTNAPIPTNSYRMELVHGMLQPKGEGILTRNSTAEFTVCLTWEDIPGHGRDLALASVYPGQPDAPWDMTDLTEGQTISGQELLDRGCIRVC